MRLGTQCVDEPPKALVVGRSAAASQASGSCNQNSGPNRALQASRQAAHRLIEAGGAVKRCRLGSSFG